MTITVATTLSTSEIRLVNDPDEPHRINKQSFVGRLFLEFRELSECTIRYPDEQEWFLYKNIESEQKDIIFEYADPLSVRPALMVQCRAARRPAYFLWNLFLVTVSLFRFVLIMFSINNSVSYLLTVFGYLCRGQNPSSEPTPVVLYISINFDRIQVCRESMLA